METLQQYRHVIDKETKEVLINSLKKIIRKSDLTKIGFIGVIGSLKEEYSHDIDILIFPSVSAKIGETIISITRLYYQLEGELKKHNERFYISVSPKKVMQEMIYYLSAIQEGGAGLIPIHSLFFPDYKSFKKFNPKGFQREIKKSLITLYGDFDIIQKIRNNLSQKDLEPYFVILDFEMNSKLKTFPRHLIRSSAESLFSYLKPKYNLNISKGKFHNISEIETEIFNLLRQLDSKVYD